MEENNKIIAEFMRLNETKMFFNLKTGNYVKKETVDCDIKAVDVYLKNNKPITNFYYHSDWNWLMEVVEKIENLPSRTLQGTYYLGNEVKIYKAINTNTHYCEINLVKESGYRIVSIQFNKESKIKSVYDACLEFIKWYNLNSEKEN